jgi:hypothetical protein
MCRSMVRRASRSGGGAGSCPAANSGTRTRSWTLMWKIANFRPWGQGVDVSVPSALQRVHPSGVLILKPCMFAVNRSRIGLIFGLADDPAI